MADFIYWSIDDEQWTLPCTVERTAEIQASEISGLLLDKTYFNDVLATYLRYDIRIEVPFGKEQEYNELYDVLTNPDNAHSFQLPYAGGTVTVIGKIENIKDIFVKTREQVRDSRGTHWEHKIHWKGISFAVIGVRPNKEKVLEDVITNGIPAFPSSTEASVGSVYIYGTTGWEKVPDGDDLYY